MPLGLGRAEIEYNPGYDTAGVMLHRVRRSAPYPVVCYKMISFWDT
jgi:hypothetical protein